MPLRLPDKWVWDFWLARDAQQHHVFYLQAPRSLGGRELRHHNASIGHAVSSDLRRLARPPRRAPPGARGQLGRPRHLDRQRDRARRPLAHALHRHQPQRTRADPAHRARRLGRPRPLDEAPGEPGPRGRRPLVRAARPDPLARPVLARPVAVRRPGSTARFHVPDHRAVPRRRADGAGVVAHARSRRPRRLGGPAAAHPAGRLRPGRVPAARPLDGRYRILFSCLGRRPLGGAQRNGSGRRRHRHVRLLRATSSTVPIRRARRRSPHPTALGPLYAGKLVESESASWAFMAFRGAGDRDFVGELTDPLPLQIDDARRLRLAVDAPHPSSRLGAR